MNIQERAAKVLQEIDAALELAEKATAGPWKASTVESVGGASIYGDVKSPIQQNRRLVASGTWTNQCDACPQIVRPISEAECNANTAFIALSRTGWPTALRCLKTAIDGMLNSHAMLLKHDWNACELTTVLTTLCDQWNQNDHH